MNKQIWNILEKPNSYPYIKDDDVCIYAREYIAGGCGYKGGPTNKLILNFKKPPSKKELSEWQYRIQAVRTFKTEAEKLFNQDSDISITAIPSSKHKAHSEYDCRFEDLFKELLKSRPCLNIEWPIEVKQTGRATHQGDRQHPDRIKKNYIWKGFKTTPNRLYVFDDVLTTGAHFRAFSNFLKNNKYTRQIIGTFWSRAIYKELSN